MEERRDGRAKYALWDLVDAGGFGELSRGGRYNGTLVTTRQETLQGLTPENIQAMHVKQESGMMMGKQVLSV